MQQVNTQQNRQRKGNRQMAKDVSLYDIALADVPELHLVPPGEYKVRISKSVSKDSKTGKPGRLLTLVIPSDPASQNMIMWISTPDPEAPERNQQAALRNIKDAVVAFNLKVNTAGQFLAIPDSDLEGLEAWANIEVQPERVDAESGKTYPPSNRIAGFVKKA
jgi:hypothetical protein